ncbi:hypothetical protein ACEUZ9_001129 [Paracoccus litorisediminis]|uniref:hypothetical protein n=1 Tax=Paracoccus litorisediminis TaxID=2006130 RepID=UPI003732868A
MALRAYEVNRNWQVRAENALAAAFRCAIEEGGNDLYAYSVLEISTGDIRKISTRTNHGAEVAVCRAIILPGGKYAMIGAKEELLEGTESRWLVFPTIPGKGPMLSLAEPFREKDRAMRRARAIGQIIGSREPPILS